MKINKIILLLIIPILLLTGCSDYRELTDISIASSIGIDKIDDKYYITTQVLDSKTNITTDEEGSSKIVLYKSSGYTIHEALRNTVLSSPKKLYIGHLKTIVISKEIAENNVSDIFDLFLRDAEASKDFNVLLANDDDIDEIMNTLTPLETIPAENIANSINISEKIQGSVTNVTFDKFTSNILETGIDAVIPIIKIINEESNEKISQNKKIVLDNKLAIFKGDKLSGYLSIDASIGYNLINKYTKESVISFKCDDTKYGSVEIFDNNTSLNYDIKSNTLNVTSKIKGALSELNCNININNEKGIKQIEDLINTRIKEIINTTINEQMQNIDSNFLGIERNIYQNNYKFYTKNKDNIKDIIKSSRVNIKADTKIIQKGIIKEGDEKY